MDGYNFFRRGGQGRKGGGVALYIKVCFDVEELGTGNDEIELLWINIRWKACRGDIFLGVYYRPPDQDEEMHEAFCEQPAEVAPLPAFILMGDFNFPDVC